MYNNHLTTATTSGPLWATGLTYQVGDIAMYSNSLYSCLVAHTAGTFATDLSANKWVQVGGGSGSASITTTVTAGQNLNTNDAVYIASSADTGRITGYAYQVDPTNALRTNFVGFVQAATSSGGTATIQLSGILAGFTGLSAGKALYASTATPGAYQQTAPTTNGQYVIQLGEALSATTISINGAGGATATLIQSNAIDWTTGKAYNAGDVAVYNNNLYSCLTSHTASAAFETDLQSSNWVLANTPQIGRNLAVAGNSFESGTVGGWQIFTTTLTGTLPSGSLTLGTAASMSLAVTSSSPLSGKYSLNLTNTASTNFTAGQGIISQAFNIDQIDQAQVMAIQFAYKNVANVTNGMSFLGTSAQTFAMYIYDVTNSAWIQPAGVYNLVQGSGTATTKGNVWQTPSNMTQFRLALVCINSTTATTPAAGAMSLYLDNFYVGPQATSAGPAMSDWARYTPTFSAGFGTVSTIAIFSRRVGDSLEVIGNFTTGTVAASTATMTIGYNGGNGNVFIDNTKIPTANNNIVGFADVNAAASTNFSWTILAVGTSVNTVSFGIQTNAQTGLTATNGSTLVGSTTVYSVNFKVPIVGWSSNTVSSADSVNRIVSMSATSSTARSVSTTTKMIFETVQFDTAGAYSSSTGVYTCPTTGYFQVNASILVGSGVGGSYATLYKNGVISYAGSQYGSNSQNNSCINCIVQCNAGDTLDIRSSFSSTTIASSPTLNFFIINQVLGPAVVQAAESVNASYYCSANFAASTTVPVNFDTKEFDSHNAVTPSATVWKFTAPVSGVYQCNTVGNSAAATGGILIYKNGTVYKFMGISVAPTAAGYNAGIATLRLNAGDYIDFRPGVSATFNGGSLATAGISNISIQRIGN